MSSAEDRGFLSRWSQRKALARQGQPLAEPPAAPPAPPAPPVPAAPAAAHPAPPAPSAPVQDPPAPAAPPAPTLEEAAALTPASDFRRFVARDVDPGVRNTALKQLFSDPHFNVMDGLDTYIEDYGQPDPLPAGMLRQMAQSGFLGLFDDEAAPAPADAAPAPAAPNAPPAPTGLPDEDTDLRLQPDDAAGRPGPAPGPGGDAGRQP